MDGGGGAVAAEDEGGEDDEKRGLVDVDDDDREERPRGVVVGIGMKNAVAAIIGPPVPMLEGGEWVEERREATATMEARRMICPRCITMILITFRLDYQHLGNTNKHSLARGLEEQSSTE